MRIFLACLGFVLVSVCLLAFATKGKKAPNYLGQRCPPDMEFIPGNGTVSSFFIGKSEETNLDYAIYLDWLQRVYVDIPLVLDYAEPREAAYGDTVKFTYNEPILKGQLSSPAFAYYPVTGCDWLQIQDYLAWKTDRLNEAILVNDGYSKWNPMQINSDNFNTEAFMVGQYEGLTGKRRLLPKDEYFDISEIKMAKTFPFLSTGYRLPTEEEWEYAARADFQNKEPGGANRYPYGKKFFLYQSVLNFRDGGSSKPLLNDVANAGVGAYTTMNGIKSASTYKTSMYGIFNMGDNVEEWLLDTYTPAVKHYANTESIYTMNGFKIAEDRDYKNNIGQFREKDSTGGMPYRIMGFKANGDELKIMKYLAYKRFNFSEGRVKNPDSLKYKTEQLQIIRKRLALIKTPYYNDNIQVGKYQDYNHWALYAYKNGPMRKESLQYYRKVRITDSIGSTKDTLVLDENMILNSKDYVEQRTYMTEDKYVITTPNDTVSLYRVVKTGTWENPSTTARRKMKESEVSANVGFRAVVPYYGLPINKRDMVNWKRGARIAPRMRKYSPGF